jgi:hypothetical protein
MLTHGGNTLAKLKKTKPASEQKAPIPVVQAPPPYTPKTAISRDALKSLYRGVDDYWDEICEHYGYEDEKPENLVRKMQAILGAVDAETAHAAEKKARDCALIMVLGAWAKGKIPGPTTERSVEQRVKRAESLAQMLEKKGQQEAADRQWDRASKLRLQLEEIREESRS